MSCSALKCRENTSRSNTARAFSSSSRQWWPRQRNPGTALPTSVSCMVASQGREVGDLPLEAGTDRVHGRVRAVLVGDRVLDVRYGDADGVLNGVGVAEDQAVHLPDGERVRARGDRHLELD